jgi:ribosome-associated toxin RatA of RatAB toxin-antitoxin module
MPRHEEQKTLAYTADELFAIVADVMTIPHSFSVQRRAISTARISGKSSLTSRSGSPKESFTSQVTLIDRGGAGVRY